MTVEKIDLSGYDNHKELLAQRYRRANKSIFIVALPLHLISSHLPIPDPEKPFEGNRKVNLPHATKFGDYWRDNVKWAVPPLLLDTLYPLSKDFEPKMEAAGVEFGVLKLPHNSGTELEILDGQHRILGWKLISEKISQELKAAYEVLARARAQADPISVQVAERKVDSLREDQERLKREYVTIEILEGVTPEDHKQYFHDIAVHARGITKSLTASFDRKDPLNRIAYDLASTHPLLRERVDFDMDTVRGVKNRNWISGKNLKDIVSQLAIGPNVSMTVRRRDAMSEMHVKQVTTAFFDALTEEFSDLSGLLQGDLSPHDVRESSLLGSSTMLRAFAGAFYTSAVDASEEGRPFVTILGENRMRNLFSSLNDRVGIPIDLAWLNTGVFADADAKAPGARTQQIKALTQALTDWAETGLVLPETPPQIASPAAAVW